MLKHLLSYLGDMNESEKSSRRLRGLGPLCSRF